MSRPELTGSASVFYNSKEARKYDSSSRMVGIQREITNRALELLKIPDDNKKRLLLDIGCGSGLSGQVISEHGHMWIGCDVSRDMLDVANERLQEDDHDAQDGLGDLMHHDMGTGLPFRAGTFDGCISISALQWLCYANSSSQVPRHRLMRFFSSLYQVLRRGARAVLQFYPETAEQAILISECAAKVGFAGGIVVDYPNSAKAKKHYLVLSFDRSTKPPAALTGSETSLLGAGDGVRVDGDRNTKKKSKHIRKKRGGVKTKEWIMKKKETQRKKGKDVRKDTKYTGRKRPTKF